MGDSSTKLSIIIPTYNYIDGLDRCIMSVLSQLAENCECIVVDDGSNEEFIERLRKYENCDADITIEYCKHVGASVARNKGIELAKGEYVAFLDGDDELAEGFIERARCYLDGDNDLCIFGIDAISEKWLPGDAIYDTASDFADEYIRNRHLLVYSQCNKFYRRSILREHEIMFDAGVSFGEDRLFNYSYIPHCGKITTSDIIMFKYNNDNAESQSMRRVPQLAKQLMSLHDAKMNCFCSLSNGTSEAEKAAFEIYDIRREVGNLLERAEKFPDERDEIIYGLNEHISGGIYEECAEPDAVVVMGSSNCAYRAEKAYEIYGLSEVPFILSGGNKCGDGGLTEAEFMRNVLVGKGVDEERIATENRSTNTAENLINTEKIINERNVSNIVFITAWFHIRRVRSIIEEKGLFDGKKLYFCPAYGPNTDKTNWFSNERGYNIIIGSLCHRGTPNDKDKGDKEKPLW